MFSIGIPTLNRYDLLADSLESYVKDFPGIDIHVLDNGDQHILPPSRYVTVHLMPENIGVAASWNLLMKEIFKKSQIAVILNDDIYWGRTKSQVLVHLRWLFGSAGAGFGVSHKGWCSFAIRKQTVQKVGYFDEQFFPAYFEDNDYSYRMEQNKIKIQHDHFFEPEIFRKSMSVSKDQSINDNFMKNSEYYIQKWGGKPGEEKYFAPFGE